MCLTQSSLTAARRRIKRQWDQATANTDEEPQNLPALFWVLKQWKSFRCTKNLFPNLSKVPAGCEAIVSGDLKYNQGPAQGQQHWVPHHSSHYSTEYGLAEQKQKFVSTVGCLKPGWSPKLPLEPTGRNRLLQKFHLILRYTKWIVHWRNVPLCW